MRKIKNLLIICLVIFFSAILLISCRVKEDCIPKELGEPEGLYFYRGNYRSLTDGSQKEQLIEEITVDGVTYKNEQLKFRCYYVPWADEIFYVIDATLNDTVSYYLWHYNYDTKESGYLYTLSGHPSVSISKNYIFVETKEKGLLYNANAELVSDKLHGYALGDEFLISYQEEFALSWWKNGVYKKIECDYKIKYATKIIGDDYFYIFNEAHVLIIDVNTGATETYSLGEDKILTTSDDTGKLVKIDNKYYFITYSDLQETQYENDYINVGCKIWSVSGTEFKEEYVCPKNLEVSFKDYNDAYINLDCAKVVDLNNTVDYLIRNYNVKSDSFGLWEKKITQEREELHINGYVFYADRISYQQTPMACLGTRSHCFYLRRITKNKDEIMQYDFLYSFSLDSCDVHTK